MKQSFKSNWFSIRVTPNVDDQKLLIDRDDIEMILSSIAEDYWFQLERGEEKGKLHFQALIYHKQRTRDTAIAKEMREFFEKDKLESMHVSASNKARKAALNRYVTKQDTRVDGPWSNKPIKQAYNGEDLMMIRESPLPMQKEILDRLEKEPDDRKVVYIWSEKGNNGKTKLVKYLAFHKLAKCLGVNNADRLASAVVKAGEQRAYFFDLPRTVDSKKSLTAVFETIECVKNGMIIDNMYGADNTLFMMPPHVFVFSNAPPPLKMLSADRWEVIALDMEVQGDPWTSQNSMCV